MAKPEKIKFIWTYEVCSGSVSCPRKGATLTTLINLFYGNIRPTERTITKGSKLDELMILLCRNEDDPMGELTKKQKESFEKFKTCQAEITDVLETEAFTSDFTIAAKFMV